MISLTDFHLLWMSSRLPFVNPHNVAFFYHFFVYGSAKDDFLSRGKLEHSAMTLAYSTVGEWAKTSAPGTIGDKLGCIMMRKHVVAPTLTFKCLAIFSA